MDMIGNRTDALKAFVDALPQIDSGEYRLIYLNNGVVYKVEKHDGIGQNELEHNRIASHRNSLPSPFLLPQTTLFDVVNGNKVLAMEFIIGTPTGTCGACWAGEPCDYDDCLYATIPEWFTHDVWSDSCIGNAIRTAEGIYIIDFVW